MRILERPLLAEDCLHQSYRGRRLRAQLGLWLADSERLLSPKETLISASWGAENGTIRTLMILR
jgi:hypothetical protein